MNGAHDRQRHQQRVLANRVLCCNSLQRELSHRLHSLLKRFEKLRKLWNFRFFLAAGYSTSTAEIFAATETTDTGTKSWDSGYYATNFVEWA